MREILFKAKRIDNGEWVEGLLSVMWGQYHIINPDEENTAYPIDKDTICQYTGLTDKNGNKIWENDVVIYDNSPYNVYCTPHTGNISYRNGCLCFKYWLYGSINYMPFTADDFFNIKCEVIGNTFDNPNFLKGE